MVVLDNLPASNSLDQIIDLRVAEPGNRCLHLIARNVVFLGTSYARSEIFELLAQIPRLKSGKTWPAHDWVTLARTAMTRSADFIAERLIGRVDCRVLLCGNACAKQSCNRGRQSKGGQ